MVIVNYFLFKTEPSSYSINDLKRDKKTSWGGIRNYQARNFIREMKVGDLVLMYHSSCAIPAVVGIGKIVKAGYADPLQFEKKSHYFDAGSKVSDPRWLSVDVAFVEMFKTPITLSSMRLESALSGMRLLTKGNRLSVFPIAQKHFDIIKKLSK